ncbi:MAG: MogA/MoaB family molybdenum cofactor biosynthesis protein [Desulfovibrio sp.]|nr:MogA/MoaB family molybdenum cofactor biosynthesis protein [Desulfovibrio sp.]
MPFALCLHTCRKGDSLPLLPATAVYESWPCHRLEDDRTGAMVNLNCLAAGTHFVTTTPEGIALFKLTGHICLPRPQGGHALFCPLLTALEDCSAGQTHLTVRKEGYSLAWVTLSDKGSQGLREDLSGPAIEDLASCYLPLCHCQGFLLPDEPDELRSLLTDLALHQRYDIICTTGSTGLSPRDIAPQVTSALLDMPLPGFTQAMMAASLAVTPHAVISRAAAGVLGQSIVINLPGSKKAALENLRAVLPALPHALNKLHGDPADCGG